MDVLEAKGSHAYILRIDEENVTVPFNQSELHVLEHELSERIDRLKKSNDYPESERDEKLLSRIVDAQFLIVS